MKRYESRTWKLIAVSLLVCLCVLVATLLTFSKDSIAYAIAAGILASFIASLVFAFIEAVLIGDPAQATRENLGRLETAVGQLEAVPLWEQLQQHGVRRVKPKGEYSEVEWLQVLREARESLVLVGHALDKWCRSAEIKQEFCATIDRLLRDHKQVRLLMLSEQAKRLKDQRHKDYGHRIRLTLEVVARLSAELPSDARAHLSVCSLDDDLEMPYMVVANEHLLITAPYPAAIESSDRMPTLTLAGKNMIANGMRTDLNTLFSERASPVALESYIGADQ